MALLMNKPASRASRRITAVIVSFSLLAPGLLGTSLPARAEEGRLRIAEQFGIVYLLLNVAQDQQLIEKHGKAAGVDIQVERVQLSGGPAINEALLSGSIDIAGAGVGPLLTLWDKTQGRQNVRGIASLGNFPYYLTSSNPAVRVRPNVSSWPVESAMQKEDQRRFAVRMNRSGSKSSRERRCSQAGVPSSCTLWRSSQAVAVAGSGWPKDTVTARRTLLRRGRSR